MQTQTLPTGRSKRSSWHALPLRMQIPGKPHAPYFLFYILAPLCNLPYEAVRHNSLRSFPKWHWPPQRNSRFSVPPRPPSFGRVPVGQRPFLRLPHPFPYPWPVSIPAYRKLRVRFPVPQASTSDGRNQLGSRKTRPCSWHRETSGKTRTPRQPRQQCFAATPSSAGW